ncbi:HD-GYP domain-containing protein [Sulfuricurvum sp.]|uniref:HD-GYP domain-containing protein n=1 Tax=Sulfuricurvum sp. TaxID=2025608 RepID=UPI002E32D28C|nr:HD-GYP domain-containing protein [Sulfuricurvum sp.]HEX5330220.1 HD-GYP domain-containing protein [Sulfuricurvum sp.]
MTKVIRYKSIDKRVITEGEKIDFTIYLPDETKTSMTLLLQSDSVVDGNSKIRLREVERLYINDEDSLRYEAYVQKHIQSIARAEDIPIESKALIIYERATSVINDMFHNPESLEIVQNTQPLVNTMVEVILRDSSAIESLMKITAHDYYTHTHSLNVSIYALSLGNQMGIAEKDLEVLGMAAMLHDIGKSKIDYDIINKNGKLTEEEFETMKAHPHIGHEIALKLGIKDKRILSGIRHHHEKLNGRGYPDRINRMGISQFARIIAVCDVFDALTTKRSYKNPMSSFEAIKLMKESMSEHLDMSIVQSLILMLHKK